MEPIKKEWKSATFVIFLVAVLVPAIIVTVAVYSGNVIEQDRCEAFCNCSISDSCPYTFDYDDVKNCDCNIGGE